MHIYTLIRCVCVCERESTVFVWRMNNINIHFWMIEINTLFHCSIIYTVSIICSFIFLPFILIASYDNTRNDNNCFLCCWIDWLVSLVLSHSSKFQRRELVHPQFQFLYRISSPFFKHLLFVFLSSPLFISRNQKDYLLLENRLWACCLGFFYVCTQLTNCTVPPWYDRPRCLLPIWLFYTPPKFTN